MVAFFVDEGFNFRQVIFIGWGAAMKTQDRGNSSPGATRQSSNSDDAARADYIEYMADMVQEMRVLAERTGCPTLAGILQLAHSEALREAGRR